MPNVHWTQPGFEAIPETDGHGDTCGIDAMCAYLSVVEKTVFTEEHISTIRADLISAGLFDHGMTMENIRDAFHRYNVTPVKFVDYNASLNLAAFRDDVIQAMNNHQCVLYETANAQALPGNQNGVQYHFVTIWGIDSDLGYYTANGDLVSDFNPWQTTPQTPVWYGIGALNASQPVGYIILPSVSEVKPVIIIEQSNGQITGAYDADNPSLRLGAGFALAAQQQNLLGDEITTGETTVGHVQVAVIGHRYLGTWTSTSRVILNDWTEVSEVVENLLSAPKPTIDNDSAVAGALANVSQSAASVATSVAELQKDIASLEIAQTADK